VKPAKSGIYGLSRPFGYPRREKPRQNARLSIHLVFMPIFWRHSGLFLCGKDAHGYCEVTDELLAAYFWRPEVRPIESSCPAELALHARLVAAPRDAVSEAELAALADADARDNYRIALKFRDRLVKHQTLEATYLALLRQPGGVDVPPLFIEQLAHISLHGLLVDEEDPFVLRAAEIFFREQRVTINDKQILLADAETVDMRHAEQKEGTQFGNLGRLLVEAQTTLAPVELDVMASENKELYWERDERHDFVIALNYGRPGLDAFARLMERWVRHYLQVEVRIKPIRQIDGARMAWFVGLDKEATSILNDLYNGMQLEESRLEKLLALFQLEFANPAEIDPAHRGRPVFLALAMDSAHTIHMKPQNLLLNLPLAARSGAPAGGRLH
jgi:hypothetical protein